MNTKSYNFILFIAVTTAFLAFAAICFIYQDKIKSFLNYQTVVANTYDAASLGFPGQRKIALDSEGNIYLAFRSKKENRYEIFVAKFDKKLGYQRITGLSDSISKIENDAPQRVPSIAIDSKDQIHAVWYGSISEKKKNERQVKYSKSSDKGASWSKWKNIASVSGYKKEEDWQEHPNIFSGKNNSLYVVWEGKDKDNKNQQIKFTKSTDGGETWDNWINIKPTKKSAESRPQILEDKNGGLYVLMYSGFEEKTQQIYYSFSSDSGAVWSDWKNISNSEFDSRHISAALDENGNIYAVWRARIEKDGPSQILYTIIKNGEPEKPMPIFASSNYQFFPNIVLSKNKTPLVTWMECYDNYGFPKEKPGSEKSCEIYLKSLQNPDSVKSIGRGFYPNLPLYDKLEFIPIIYSKNYEKSEIILNKIFY